MLSIASKQDTVDFNSTSTGGKATAYMDHLIKEAIEI
jgi:hypothetical protein